MRRDAWDLLCAVDRKSRMPVSLESQNKTCCCIIALARGILETFEKRYAEQAITPRRVVAMLASP